MIVFHLLTIFNIVKEQLKLEQEENKLSLRKNKINNILFSKRKIPNYLNETNEEFQREYLINMDDLNIPKDFKINFNKFCQNVSLILIFIF